MLENATPEELTHEANFIYLVCVAKTGSSVSMRNTQRIMLTSPKIAPDAPTDGAVQSA